MKRMIAILLAVCLVWGLAGCHKEVEEPVQTAPITQPVTEPVTEPAAPKIQVELCLPEQTQLWESCAKSLQTCLTEQGYATQVYYAGGSALEQAKQLQTLIQKGAEILVVASVDAHTLEEELQSAAAAGVKVVALDRQVLHAQSVSAAITFDYLSLGVAMGHQIVEEKQLTTAKEEDRTYTIEFLMGAADDQNAVQIHQGIMAVLQPYIDKGVLVSKSGRVSMEDTYIQRWDAELAKTKFSQYMEFYGDILPDIVCAASDELAAGCMAVLSEAGYDVEKWPVITGIGGGSETIRNILDGKQDYTIYRDVSAMYEKCAQIVRCLLENETLPQQDNTGEVPTYFSTAVQVNGVAGIGVLLDEGISMKQLGLTEADVDRILQAEAPETTEATEPAETNEPTEATEPTETPTETK